MPGATLDPQAFAAALLDAWSIIDAVHRLRGLMKHIPGFPKRMRVPAIRYFFQHSKPVEALRNTVQHLPEKIRNQVPAPDWSVWGSLNWWWVRGDNRLKHCTFFSGRVVPSERILLTVEPTTIWPTIGKINLSQGDQAVCISDLIIDVETLANELQQVVARAHADRPELEARYPSDLCITVDIQLNDPTLER